MAGHDNGRHELARGVRLLWGAHVRPSRGPRPTLSLDHIVQTAVDIADSEGLAALSMQRLAHALGVGTMSLYRYVPGKSELVSLMLDAVIGEPPRLDPRHWRRALRRWANGNRDIFLGHPWTFSVVAGPRVLGPNETAWAEAALRAVSRTGLPPGTMLEVVFLLNSYVRGAVQLAVGQGPGDDTGTGPSFDLRVVQETGQQDRFPLLTGLLNAFASGDQAPPGDDDQFDFGLQRVLDGIEALVQSET
jgi:AcrR family transcriptional regulator